ncbi:hypothetical protein LWI28_018071 [Acer negundo]|uniref:Uncharacterized protein n=1 Tax=Acer negundo TaxID=4023 RepID=A0AAD5P2F9_ACENE|nr:hypothetical protein LWI28_018071 [Acer negundo]
MQHGHRQLNTIPIIQMTIPRQAKQKAVLTRNPMVCNLPFSFFLQFFTRKTKRVALAMAFFSAAAISAQDLAPSSAPVVGAGVSLLVSGAVVGFSLDERKIRQQKKRKQRRKIAANFFHPVAVIFKCHGLLENRGTIATDLRERLQFGRSANIRIGLAQQETPFNIPHCVARRTSQLPERNVKDQMLNSQVTTAQHVERERAYYTIASLLKIPFLDEEVANNLFPRKKREKKELRRLGPGGGEGDGNGVET